MKVIVRRAKKRVARIGQEARGTVAILISIAICVAWVIGAMLAVFTWP